MIVMCCFFLLVKAQTVSTQYGPVTGHMNGTVYEFLGIPYASPPQDTLRWKPTMSPESWNDPIIADSFPPMCPQKKYNMGDTTFTLGGNEDCLYLNVWTPDISGSFPVMVFIHGGGNQQGSTGQVSGGTEIYHGKNLTERGSVVTVTIQYRLGALGYLVHPGLEEENQLNTSGNYGVMDQLFALQWVQNNISAFGGNPDNVTIFGESGGGVNVGNLLTTSQANGLFHRAIIQSATPVLNSYDTAKIEGIDFVNDFISTGTDSAKIAYMRGVHPDSISILNSSPLEGGIVQMGWQPVVDNYIFLDFPLEIFQTGNYNHVPLIVGSNADEMKPMVPQTVFPFMVNVLLNLFVPPDLQQTAQALYPAGSSPEEAKDAYAGILTDVQFTSNSRRTAQCISLNQTEPVYRYLFTHAHYDSIPIIGDWRSYHGIELYYVFNTWENSPMAIGPWFTPQDDSVQSNMLQYWVNFAYNGDPNNGILPQWPVYDADTDPYLEIKATPDGSQSGLRTGKCDLWDAVAGFEGCSSSVGILSNNDMEELLVYPNPSEGKYYFDPGIRSNFEIILYNSVGQVILTATNPTHIDLTDQHPGIYFVHVIGDDRLLRGKLVKIE